MNVYHAKKKFKKIICIIKILLFPKFREFLFSALLALLILPANISDEATKDNVVLDLD